MIRRNKGYLISLSLAFVVMMMIATKAFPSYAEVLSPSASEGRSYPAEVEDISGEKYFPAVKQALSQAKESILWFTSLETLSKRFNVSRWMLSKGMQELRKLNLIDVEYPPLDKEGAQRRLAKSYKLLNLYDPAWLEGEWDRLELLYGVSNLEKARDFAEIVYEENDPEIIEDIIKRIGAFGEKQVKAAFSIVAKKNPDNPKRCYLYVRGIIDKMAEQR